MDSCRVGIWRAWCDFELYGLSIDEIAIVRSAFNIAQKGNADEMIALGAYTAKLVELAKRSAASGEREVM